jgi:hypothetical protein
VGESVISMKKFGDEQAKYPIKFRIQSGACVLANCRGTKVVDLFWNVNESRILLTSIYEMSTV